MRCVIDSTANIAAAAATIDAELGYPQFGVDVETGKPILPKEGQTADMVRGVSLRWAEPILKHDDPSLAAYPYDATTAPFLDALGLSPVELPEDWFPPTTAP